MVKNKKLSSIITASMYFVAVIFLVIAATVVFNNNYFFLIYVDGQSMSPTLNKNATEFGIVDRHASAINKIERFDIVTTYYPIFYQSFNGYTCDYATKGQVETLTAFSPDNPDIVVSSFANYKIKRIIALPGEQFKVTNDGVEVKVKDANGTYGEPHLYTYNFEHTENPSKLMSDYKTLGDDQYWVLGDNWANSLDSGALDMPIYKQNIQGVLVAIQGTCQVVTKDNSVSIKNKHYYFLPRYF